MKNIDWTAVLDNLYDHLRDLQRMERQCDPEDEKNNPYMWDIFSFQEMIGCIERDDYDEAYRLLKEEFGEGYFDCVYGQREGVAIKPDPTAVYQIIEEVNVKPENCLYIGDTGTDMETGKNAKLCTVGVLWGFRDKEELLQNGADIIIEKPCQLLDCINARKEVE